MPRNTKKQSVGRSNVGKINAIKRINERKAEIAREVQRGKLPRVYLNNFNNAILAAIKDPSLLTKSGNISHGSKAVKALNASDLKALLNRETASEAKKTAQKNFREEKELYKSQYWDEYDEESGPLEDYTYEDYINDMNAVYDALDNYHDDTYSAFKMAFQGSKGKKTYAQLHDAINSYEGSNRPVTRDIEEVYFK